VEYGGRNGCWNMKAASDGAHKHSFNYYLYRS
jgi:hypothetical protein